MDYKTGHPGFALLNEEGEVCGWKNQVTGKETFPPRWSLDSSGNPVGLYGPDGELLMEFVDVGGSSASATVEV